MDASSSKAVFAEAGLWDYIMALAARAFTSRSLVGTTPHLLVSSSLESASTRLALASSASANLLRLLTVHLSRARGRLGAVVLSLIVVAALASVSTLILTFIVVF